MSLFLGYPKVIPIAYQLWTLWDHSFLSYAQNIIVKNALSL